MKLLSISERLNVTMPTTRKCCNSSGKQGNVNKADQQVGMENQNSNHMATNAKQRKVKGDIKANKNDRNLSKTNKKTMKRSRITA